jgi:hypothetical protein
MIETTEYFLCLWVYTKNNNELHGKFLKFCKLNIILIFSEIKEEIKNESRPSSERSHIAWFVL